MQLLVTSDKYRGSRTLPPILLQGANSAREPSKPELDCNQVWLHMIYFSQPSTNILRRTTLSCCIKSLNVTIVRNCLTHFNDSLTVNTRATFQFTNEGKKAHNIKKSCQVKQLLLTTG